MRVKSGKKKDVVYHGVDIDGLIRSIAADEDSCMVRDVVEVVTKAPQSIDQRWDGKKWVSMTDAVLRKIILRNAREEIAALAGQALVTLRSESAAQSAVYAEKSAEARLYLADKKAATPIIDAEIKATGEKKAALVQSIAQHDDRYRTQVGLIEGARRRVYQELEATKDMESLHELRGNIPQLFDRYISE